MKLKMKDMPQLLAFYLLSLKNRTKRLNPLRQKTKSFEMRSIYLKVNKPSLKFVVLKRVMIFLLKMKEENEILEKAGNQVQEKTKLRSIILKPAELISLFLSLIHISEP